MYKNNRNLQAKSELDQLYLRQEQLKQEMKELTVAYNMFDLDPDIPIYRITPAEHLLRDLRERRLTLTRINMTNWGDDRENPILGKVYRTASGEECNLGTTENIFGQCWSSRELGSADWEEFRHGRPAVRVQTTPRKLLSGIIDPKNRYYSLQHWIGMMRYEDQSTIDSFFSAPDFTEHLDPTGERAMLSLLRLHHSLVSEAEVRILFDYYPENEWDKENVFLQEPRAAVRFDWANVVTGLKPEPGLEPVTFAELQSAL